MSVIFCRNCGKKYISDTGVVCPECGCYNMTNKKRFWNRKNYKCPKCGEKIFQPMEYCPACRFPLDMIFNESSQKIKSVPFYKRFVGKFKSTFKNHKEVALLSVVFLTTFAISIIIISANGRKPTPLNVAEITKETESEEPKTTALSKTDEPEETQYDCAAQTPIQTERPIGYMSVINRLKNNPDTPEVAPGVNLSIQNSGYKYSNFALLDMDGDGKDELLCWWKTYDMTIASVYKEEEGAYKVVATVPSLETDPHVNYGALYYVYKNGKYMLLKIYEHGIICASYGLLELNGSDFRLYDGYYFTCDYSDGFASYSLDRATLSPEKVIIPGKEVIRGDDESIHIQYMEHLRKEMQNAVLLY